MPGKRKAAPKKQTKKLKEDDQPVQLSEEWWEQMAQFFQSHYAPTTMSGREEQGKFLDEKLNGENGGAAFLYGNPGTGKTAYTRLALKRFSPERSLHLTCTSYRTTKIFLEAVADWIGLKVTAGRKKLETVLQELWNGIEDRLFSGDGEVLFLVLDEVDFFMKKTTSTKIKGTATFKMKRTTTSEEVVEEMVRRALSQDSRATIIAISNEHMVMGPVGSLIPDSNKQLFPEYTVEQTKSKQLKGIVSARLEEAKCDSNLIFSRGNEAAFIAMKANKQSTGDCRMLLENMRRLLLRRSTAETKENGISMEDVAAVLPFRNELTAWMKSVGDTERLVVVCALVMKAKVPLESKSLHTLTDLSKAYHAISEKFLGGLHPVEDPFEVLGYVEKLSMALELISVKRLSKKKSSNNPDHFEISINSQHLAAGNLFASLKSISNTVEGTTCPELMDILKHYLASELEGHI